jgi:methylated-DNA-[protein]-cysteine S-methyltransferase
MTLVHAGATHHLAAWGELPSALGPLLLGTDGVALTCVFFDGHRSAGRADPRAERVREAADRDDAHPVLAAAREQLGAYLARRLRAFDLPLAPAGSAFQQRVWAALVEIPYGRTATYGDVALRLGLPVGAARAVGLANGQNPISIVVPCHRVVGAAGALTGYAGGLDRKRTLLDLERDLLF